MTACLTIDSDESQRETLLLTDVRPSIAFAKTRYSNAHYPTPDILEYSAW
jgi:hypothetical protein